ncbi:unnamed protein product [Spirodela intermedia]|uniref:Uncharacterized protein n=1 Tax=Spirodela intermedia TaxID=51605 RepID=A0A7I8IHW4_SPIIN|nr:unnamed protein product [Spirodela intermedia]CAA6657473.1 unnamed protein product [Spirodela intermedia]
MAGKNRRISTIWVALILCGISSSASSHLSFREAS